MRPRSTSQSASLILLGLLWLLSSPCAAEEPGDDVSAEVDKRVDQATQSFVAQKYDQSVREWEAAYALDPQPIFLFNKAQSYRRGGRSREALGAYRLYLQKDPKTSLRAETAGYISELMIVIETEEQRERERRRPVWKKGWFWGVMGTVAAVVGAGVGLGLAYGLRDQREVLEPRFN